MFKKWRKRRQCMHHIPSSTSMSTVGGLGESFIRSQFINSGAGKMFWCDKEQGGCGKTWFV